MLSINSKNVNDTNDSSIVIELTYDNTKYLFMGDASTEIENSREWNEVDVLKVAHHGGDTSTSQSFVNKIKPKYAIISVGKNDYGHPTDEVLENLKNVTTFRTDKDNSIWLTSDGKSIEVKKLNYNIDGAGRKHASIFKKVFYNAFFFNFEQHDISHHFSIVACHS